MNQLPPTGDSDNARLPWRPSGPPAMAEWSGPPDPFIIATSSRSTLLAHWYFLRHARAVLVAFAVAGAIAGFLFSLPQAPVYRSRTTIEVQNLNENYLNLRGIEPIAVNYGADSYIQTQIQVLQSETLRTRVIEQMLEKIKDTEIHVPASRLQSWLTMIGVRTPEQADGPEQIVHDVARSLSVRGSGLTRIIQIQTESTNPQLAADFANILMTEYTEQNLETRWAATQSTSEWLTRQLRDLQIKLEKSEEELHRYAGIAGLVFTSPTENVADLKLKQIQEEYLRAHADRIAKQSIYEQATASPPEAVPETLNDATLQSYRAKLSDLRREQAELFAVVTPEHPKLVRVQAQIQEMREIVAKERGDILRRIKNEYEAAARRELLLGSAQRVQAKTVGEQAEKAVHYKILQREVETTRQLYESMLQKMKEAGVASAMSVSNIRVIDRAEPAEFPSKPNLALSTLVGLFGGSFLGVAFVSLRDKADRRLKNPEDVHAYLNVPELGVIPSAASDLSTARIVKRRNRLKPMFGQAGVPDGNAGLPGERDEEYQERLELVLAQHPYSVMAEAYRATLTSILFCEPGVRSRVVVFTSPSQGEGKTTTVSNIALALAEVGQRVLVIDADVRRPKLHRIFNVPSDVTLSEILKETPGKSITEASIESLVRATAYPGLYVLPTASGLMNTASLLHSPRLDALLRRFRSEFDAILIDSAPTLNMFDARVVARLADAVLLVLRMERTTRDTALAAMRQLAKDGTNLLGLILNDWDPNRKQLVPYTYGYYQSAVQTPHVQRISGD